MSNHFKRLIDWSEQFRDLPWRKKRSLYRTLVSEIMLQQTTVTTVIKHFEGFLREFPILKALAKANEEDVLIAWKGLGYYRRAKNLKKASEELFERGDFPQDFLELKKIPGIGDYTAAAIRAIGMNQPDLAVDANIERILSRYFAIEKTKGRELQKYIQSAFIHDSTWKNLRQIEPRKLNEALMDVGRTVCRARQADCVICPLGEMCQAFKENRVGEFPILPEKAKKKQAPIPLELLRVMVQKDGQVLVYQKKNQEWLAGQFELPTFIIKTPDTAINQYPYLSEKVAQTLKLGKKLTTKLSYKTFITKYKIQNHIIILSEREFFKKFKLRKKDFSYARIEAKKANLSTASLKAIKLLNKNQEEG